MKDRKVGDEVPQNYAEWLAQSFGSVFAEKFPAAYTRKYWTREPCELTTDWVGSRIYRPNIEEVIAGSKGPLGRQTHYIKRVRYPRKGGYESYARKIRLGANIQFEKDVATIDLQEKKLWTRDGKSYQWDRLINTLPLPVFLAACSNVPSYVLEAADLLACTSLLLVNITAAHQTLREENWMYIYDEDKFSTRINCTEKLAVGNAPIGHTGIQTEVYYSKKRPLSAPVEFIEQKVKHELIEFGLLRVDAENVTSHTVNVPWANVIFEHSTAPALDGIWNWLAQFGLQRDDQDLHPLTDWERYEPTQQSASLVMAGRFGQWKYYWSDDCVLRGRQVATGSRRSSLAL
jgi:protoporphyrinogen oxidase